MPRKKIALPAPSDSSTTTLEDLLAVSRAAATKRTMLLDKFAELEATLTAANVAVVGRVTIQPVTEADGSYSGVYWALAWRRAEQKGSPVQWGLFVERWEEGTEVESLKERVPVSGARRDLRVAAAHCLGQLWHALDKQLCAELDELDDALKALNDLASNEALAKVVVAARKAAP